jgi:N-glycosidase YbiA
MAETTGVVNFYSVGDEFGEFSNFAPYPFALDGEQWQTSEHYFQAQKFEDTAYRTRIRKSNSPMLAARNTVRLVS